MDELSRLTLPPNLSENVAAALKEDIGNGDINAALIPATQTSTAVIYTRQTAVIAGCAYATEAFRQLDANTQIYWQVKDGDSVTADTCLCRLQGQSRALLSGERTALNFLQTLSGTATTVRQYVDAVAKTSVRLLDTRKTLPGLRLAQKYAVRCGGAYNHRFGLFDAFLIKENHIKAAGSIANAITAARQQQPMALVEIEVENLAEYQEAIQAKPDRILLDNFSIEATITAVTNKPDNIELEASGNISIENIPQIAATGVDYISLGTLTKNVQAIDLSMRFIG